MKKSFCTLTWMAASAIAAAANGQATTSYEDGPDGVKYRVTRQVVQRSIPTTEYQARTQTMYSPQVTTEYQSYQQNYITPVTQYQYVPHLRNWWNPFTGAYWTHDLQPVTTWQVRPSTVQVPVTTYKTVPEEYTSKVAVSVPTGTSVASSSLPPSQPIGGQQMLGDPPRTASQFSPPTTYSR